MACSPKKTNLIELDNEFKAQKIKILAYMIQKIMTRY
jgi:hypothetical protein